MRRRDVSTLSRSEAELTSAISSPVLSMEQARARRLKERIETYWRERGYRIEVTFVSIASSGGETIGLVSNTINGLPA